MNLAFTFLLLSCFSRVQLFEALWTVVCQAPPSVGFSRQESGSGLPFPSPGDLFDPGMEPRSLTSPTLVCILSHFNHVRLCDPMDCSLPGPSVHGILKGKNTGVGCHVLLPRIFPTQGLIPRHLLSLLHCRRILYHWATWGLFLGDIQFSHKKLTILDWQQRNVGYQNKPSNQGICLLFGWQ